MDEDKPQHSQADDLAEDSQGGGNSLVSKLARAYSSLPPEQRGARALPNSGDSVSNPEVGHEFQKLLKELEMYKMRREQKPDPKVVALLEKKIEDLRARGDGLSLDGASAKPALAEEVGSFIRGGVRCRKCGQDNSASNRFCGLCGAEISRSGSVPGDGIASTATARPQPEHHMFSVEHGDEERFPVFKIGLLALLLAGAVLFAPSQWPVWRQQLFRVNWIARLLNASQISSTDMTPAPVPAERVATSTDLRRAPQPPPAMPTPSKSVQNTPPKHAPPMTIRQHLPGPVPLSSALGQIEVAASAQPESTSGNPNNVAPPGQEAPVGALEAPQTPPKPTHLSPAVAQGGLIFKVDPEYPPIARMGRIQGHVLLHAIIGTDGTVEQLRVVSGNPLLASSALNAVKMWRYRPYVVDGHTVEVETTVILNFKGED